MNYVGKQACHMGASMSNNISGRWCKSFEIQLFVSCDKCYNILYIYSICRGMKPLFRSLKKIVLSIDEKIKIPSNYSEYK